MMMAFPCSLSLVLVLFTGLKLNEQTVHAVCTGSDINVADFSTWSGTCSSTADCNDDNDCTVTCSGLGSCQSGSIDGPNDLQHTLNVNCDGQQSCQTTNISCIDSNNCTISCGDQWSCAEMIIYCPKYADCIVDCNNANQACLDSIMNCADGHTCQYINCDGSFTCDGVTQNIIYYPTAVPTVLPTNLPATHPTTIPTNIPSNIPTSTPSKVPTTLSTMVTLTAGFTESRAPSTMPTPVPTDDNASTIATSTDVPINIISNIDATNLSNAVINDTNTYTYSSLYITTVHNNDNNFIGSNSSTTATSTDVPDIDDNIDATTNKTKDDLLWLWMIAIIIGLFILLIAAIAIIIVLCMKKSKTKTQTDIHDQTINYQQGAENTIKSVVSVTSVNSATGEADIELEQSNNVNVDINDDQSMSSSDLYQRGNEELMSTNGSIDGDCNNDDRMLQVTSEGENSHDKNQRKPHVSAQTSATGKSGTKRSGTRSPRARTNNGRTSK